MHNQSHLGWHFRKLKAQSSNVSFATFQWKETLELWALSFETAFENVTPSGIGCTSFVCITWHLIRECSLSLSLSHMYLIRECHVTPHLSVSYLISEWVMGWLRLVGSLKLQVSFAKEPYKRDDILQKRPMTLRSVLTVATPEYVSRELWGCAS